MRRKKTVVQHEMEGEMGIVILVPENLIGFWHKKSNIRRLFLKYSGINCLELV